MPYWQLPHHRQIGRQEPHHSQTPPNNRAPASTAVHSETPKPLPRPLPALWALAVISVARMLANQRAHCLWVAPPPMQYRSNPLNPHVQRLGGPQPLQSFVPGGTLLGHASKCWCSSYQKGSCRHGQTGRCWRGGGGKVRVCVCVSVCVCLSVHAVDTPLNDTACQSISCRTPVSQQVLLPVPASSISLSETQPPAGVP